MSRKTAAARLVRFAGIAGLLAVFAAACEVPTAPRFPDGEKEDPKEQDDQ